MRQAQKQITAGAALSQANEASCVLDFQVIVMPMLVLVRLVAFVRTVGGGLLYLNLYLN